MYKRPTIIQWRCFVEAVLKGSMLQASQSLGMEVSEVSQQIKALEEALGEPLLERSRRGVRPTWAGQRRLRNAVGLLKTVDQVFRKDPKKETKVRIAVHESLNRLFLDWIGRFEKEIGIGGSVEMVQFVGNIPDDIWSYDLFICVGVLPNERVIAKPLGRMERIICASSDFAKTQGLPQRPELLSGYFSAAMKDYVELLTSGKQKIGLKVNPQILVNSTSSLIDTALLGQSLAIGIPTWAVIEEIKEGRLVRVLPEWELEPSKVWVVSKPHDAENNFSKKLYLYFLEQWRKEPGLLALSEKILSPAEPDYH